MGLEETLGYIEKELKEEMQEKKVKSLINDMFVLFGRMKAKGTPMVTFMEYLRTNTDWIKAKSSKAGIKLLEYGIRVAKEILKIKEKEKVEVEDESCVLIGLFHEIGLVRADEEKFEEIEKEDPEVRGMRIASRGLRMIANFIPMDPEEVQAIIYHDVKEISVERKNLTVLLDKAIKEAFG